MSDLLSFTLSTTDPRLAPVLIALGISLPASETVPTGSASLPVVGMDAKGLAVVDDHGAAVIADVRNASDPYINALRLLASKSNVTVAELQAVVGGTTLAGHRAATTKRVQRALGGKRGAVLYSIENGIIVMADATREALARHFGFLA